MSLSFREQAAISYSTKTDRTDMWLLEDDEAVALAQSLAVECCAQWGHDMQPRQPIQIGAATLAVRELNRLPMHLECTRCGLKGDES